MENDFRKTETQDKKSLLENTQKQSLPRAARDTSQSALEQEPTVVSGNSSGEALPVDIEQDTQLTLGTSSLSTIEGAGSSAELATTSAEFAGIEESSARQHRQRAQHAKSHVAKSHAVKSQTASHNAIPSPQGSGALTSAYLASLNQPPISQNNQDRQAKVAAHIESMARGECSSTVDSHKTAQALATSISATTTTTDTATTTPAPAARSQGALTAVESVGQEISVTEDSVENPASVNAKAVSTVASSMVSTGASPVEPHDGATSTIDSPAATLQPSIAYGVSTSMVDSTLETQVNPTTGAGAVEHTIGQNLSLGRENVQCAFDDSCSFNKVQPSLFAPQMQQGVVEAPVQFAVPCEQEESELFEPLFAQVSIPAGKDKEQLPHCKQLEISKPDAEAIYAAATADESSALSIFRHLNHKETVQSTIDHLRDREMQAAKLSRRNLDKGAVYSNLAQDSGEIAGVDTGSGTGWGVDLGANASSYAREVRESKQGGAGLEGRDVHIDSVDRGESKDFSQSKLSQRATFQSSYDVEPSSTLEHNTYNIEQNIQGSASLANSANNICTRGGGVLSHALLSCGDLAQKDAATKSLYFNNGNRIIRKAVIVSKVYHRPVGGAIVEVARLLNNLGVEAYTDQSTAIGFNLEDVPVISRRGMKDTDLIIVVGGDGSVLGASRSLVDLQVPVLGINRGHLGLLTDISPSNIEDALTKVVSGNYTTEKRMMLDVKVLRRDEEGSEELIGQSLALNETVIHSGILAHMIVCRVSINGRYMYTMRSDGIIVGTPTGSTAYSLSAGGPIIEPHLDVLCLVPMFPQSLNCSPIILPGKSNVEIEFEIKDSMPEWVNINCDGQVTIRADTKCFVNIHQHSNQLQLIHPAGYDYYSVLRQKLGWGQSLVN